jgi:IS30 family transposase
MVERKSGYAVLAKVSNKTSDLVSSAIVSNLKPFAIRVKTLTYDNGKEFAGHSLIDQELNSTAYFARPFASWERGSTEQLMGCCANTFQRSEPCLLLVMRKLE